MTEGFPDPRTAPIDEPLALSDAAPPEALAAAYRQGIFVWPSAEDRVWWWSPSPRAILPLDGLVVSRSLRRVLRSGRFEVTVDQDFSGVVEGCASTRAEGTWITAGLASSLSVLHQAGIAHSVEVWHGDRLVGGLYGLVFGGAFLGESMFHRVSDASKVALVALVDRLRDRGFVLLDCQLQTDHLARMGAVEIPRDTYLDLLEVAVELPVRF